MPIGAIVVVAAVLLGAGGAYYAGAFEFLAMRRYDDQAALRQLWSSGRYEDLIEEAESVLDGTPLDPSALVYGGFAYFYGGLGQVDAEDRMRYLSRATVLMRKALHLDYAPLRAEIHYVLGKTYYHRGSSYHDLVIEHLQRAVEMGYEATDTYEYLALAYTDLGEYDASAQSLRTAIDRNPSDVLYFTLGEVQARAERYSQAISALETAIAMSSDRVLTERARFALGDVLTEAERYDEAEAVYREILDANPDSADAHYHIGNIHEIRGSAEQARFEWREAFRLDPNHAEALRKLQNN
ncbi:MAG: tetratricopeptide repeat protein [Spirochaetaceae bacterium]